MPSIEEEEEENHNAIVHDEDLEDDDDEDDDDDEEDLESDDEIDEDDDEIDHHTNPPLKQEQPPPAPIPPPPAVSPPPDQKRQHTTTTPAPPLPPIPIPIPPEERKPLPIDDSRRLFQRLWTDEDEIGLLQGFLEYTSQRGGFKSSAYHHDTAPFYDQIKSRLQLDFNKSQLVEKLRRLKKKYRNAMARINSGKDLSFKTAHDQATFEISKKIWSDIGGVDDEDHTTPVYPHVHVNDTATQVNGNTKVSPPASASSSRKRPRTTTTPLPMPMPTPTPVATAAPEENVPDHTNLIEETVKSCLGPLFKELMHSAANGRIFGGLGLNPLGMNFGGNSSMNFLGGVGEREMIDEKWRKQQILELEVYSKRVELVQEQIKLALEELRSNELSIQAYAACSPHQLAGCDSLTKSPVEADKMMKTLVTNKQSCPARLQPFIS